MSISCFRPKRPQSHKLRTTRTYIYIYLISEVAPLPPSPPPSPWGIKLNALPSFFYRVKEACILLNLLPGSVVLLRDLLKTSESVSEGECISPACAALQDAGVYRLTLEDALKVLNLRVHLPSV